MDITTKELFELAEFYWKNGPELDDDSETERIDWEDLSPAWQAEEAESIRALLGELENRGWTRLTYPQRYIFGGNSEYTFPDIRAGWALWDNPLLPRTPRTWSRIEDVPTDVMVTDEDGDFWKFQDGNWVFRFKSDEENDAWGPMSGPNDHRPFTEVIEEEEEIEWSHWDRVPEGVKYQGNSDKYGESPVWVNRGGKRMHIDTCGVERASYQPDIQETYAPFVKVEG